MQVVNAPAFLEVGNGEVLIFIATNIPIELFPTSPVLPKTTTMEHLPLNDTAYFEHQVDLIRQELTKNVTANNDYKKVISKRKRG